MSSVLGTLLQRIIALEAGGSGGGGSSTTVTANPQTGTSYTLVLADAGKAVEMNNAAANTVTIPPTSSVAFPVGTVLEVVQVGAGQTTIVAGAGVTLRPAGTLATRAQWATIGLRQRATNEWVVSGDLA